MMDAKAQGRAKTRMFIVKADQVRIVLKAHPEGLTNREISERTGLSDDDVRNAVSRLKWGGEIETRHIYTGGKM